MSQDCTCHAAAELWDHDDKVRLADQPRPDDALQAAYDLAYRDGFRAGRKCGENLARAEMRRERAAAKALTRRAVR